MAQASMMSLSKALTTLMVTVLVFHISSTLYLIQSVSNPVQKDVSTLMAEKPMQQVGVTPKQSKENKRVAVAISVTNEVHHKFGEAYNDIASALAQSVYEWEQQSEYAFDLIAFVLPNMTRCVRRLEAFGFRVLKREVPVKIQDIQPGKYRDIVDKSGCCGLSEFLKLQSYTLDEYYRVIHVDTDFFFTNGGIDELLDLPDHYKLVHTNSTLHGEHLSGGFLIIKPDRAVLHEIIDIVKEGNFRRGKGWNMTGYGACWGGETVQGILPYYYMHLHPGTEKEPSFLRVNRCIYNQQGHDSCMNTDVGLIKGQHMTLCQKPIMCFMMKHKPICANMQNEWWRLRDNLVKRLGFKATARCNRHGKFGGKPTYDIIEIE